MNKDNNSSERKSNKSTYTINYNKKMYKQLKFDVKPDFYELFNNYCTDNNISKAELLRCAVMEYIDRH